MPTRPEIGASLNLSEIMIANGRRNRPGISMKPAWITVHNTDNATSGADAEAHAKFVTKTGYYMYKGKQHWVSWHYTVDDGKVIKHLPIYEVAYHAGDAANQSSIAIEICMNAGIDHAAANDRAARLVAVLLHDLKMKADKVRTHKSWTGKKCPSQLLSDANNLDWDGFVDKVADHLSSITEAPTDDIVSADIKDIPDEAQVAAQALSAEVREDMENDIDHEALAGALSGEK